MMNAGSRVAILGGVRIPFARQNTNYAAAGNLDMLTATLKYASPSSVARLLPIIHRSPP